MKKLTKRQSEILDYISSSIITGGISPSLKEIGDRFGISPEGAYYFVKALEKKGCIRLDRNKKRNITLPESVKETRENIPFPFYDTEPTREDIEKGTENLIMLPLSMKKDDVFAYRVTSFSMVNAGILPGDTAVIKRKAAPGENDIVLAEKDEESPLELRRLHKAQGYAELWAENDTTGIIRRKEFKIYGILLEIRRSY